MFWITKRSVFFQPRLQLGYFDCKRVYTVWDSQSQTLLSKISKIDGVEEKRVRGGHRRRSVVAVRKLFCQISVKRLGYSVAAVARFLGVTTSLVNRYASSEEVGNLGHYL